MTTFPILNSASDRKAAGDALVRSVPWSLVEPLRERCAQIHGQTLERLAQRGGLGTDELWAHLNAPEPFRRSDWWASLRKHGKTQRELHEWLRSLCGAP